MTMKDMKLIISTSILKMGQQFLPADEEIQSAALEVVDEMIGETELEELIQEIIPFVPDLSNLTNKEIIDIISAFAPVLIHIFVQHIMKDEAEEIVNTLKMSI